MRKKYQQFHSATLKAFKIAFMMLFLLTNCAVIASDADRKSVV